MKHVMRSLRRWWGVAGVVMLAVAALACAASGTGGGGTPIVPLNAQGSPTAVALQQTEAVVVAGPASRVDPCTLLTQADAEVIFSGASQPGVPDETASLMYSCTYSNQAGDRKLQVIEWTFDTPTEAKGQLMDTISSSMNAQVVNGIGDYAYFDTSGYARIFFTRGSYYIALIVNPGDENMLAILTATSQTILARLP